ncbi:MAG: RluA family pseudouridine synthase [Polyangiales bacterium]
MTARRVSLEALPADVGERVDRVVAARLEAEGVTRSAVSRYCDEGRVAVRGAPAKASQRVRAGDVIEVEIPAPEPVAALPEDIPLTVVYEDRDLLVVDKPAGLVVHPAKGHATGTLVNAVLHHAEVDDEDADPLRPGIVHRIDRFTSGLLVVALTPTAREALQARFRAHDIERSYLALCEGAPGAVTFDTFYDRHPTDRLRFSSRVKEGRRAVTHVEPVERLAGGKASYVRCRLETGRTHQIRVHMSDAGFPLLGDAVYGRRARDERVRVVAEALGRQALHAAVLGFAHPVTGKALRFESAPPEDFTRALAALRALG